MSALVEIQNVRKSYGDHVVLDDLKMSIAEHEVVCLIGASGSGKSTLLRCINALETIDSGQVYVAGEPVHGEWVDVNAIRENIGMVFQQFNLFPRLSVIDNITLAPRKVLRLPKGQARELGMEWLERVGLADKADALPGKLSGGQQQRVAIARALAMQPRVMLLDEITSALDPELVGEVLDIVRQLAQSGMTLVLATHEMAFAQEVSDRVCFLVAGQIYEEGPPSEILVNPQRELTRGFLRRVVEAGRM
ncbi:MAG: amino acid ABC transporter ATP-binding protein [Microbacterium sp.]